LGPAKEAPRARPEIKELEVAGKDADDRVGNTVQDEAFTGRVVSSFVAFPPKAVVEDNDTGGAFETFLDVEGAAAKKLGSEDLEKTGGDLGGNDGLGALAGAEAHRRWTKAGEVYERAIPLAPVNEVRCRSHERGRRILFALAEKYDAIGLGVGEWPEQERIDEPEDGRVARDGERERQYSEARDEETFSEISDCETNILEETKHHAFSSSSILSFV
jgi:hypothetical protein